MAKPRRGSSPPAPKRPPNHQLRWQRLEKGWSCVEVARQIKRSMLEDGEKDTGLSGETVRRWETGERAPTAIYKKHLVKIFGLQASRLGLLTDEELALRPAEPALPVIGDNGFLAGLVAETVKQVLQVVHEGNSAASHRIRVRRMLEHRAHSRATARTPASTQHQAITSRRGRTLDPRLVAEMASITASQQQLYFTTDASTLLDAVLSHLQMGVDQLTMPQAASEDFRALAGTVALSALLAARLAFFDLGELDLANDCFALSADAVEASRDHALGAAVRAHQAFVPGFADDANGAQSLLDAAHAQIRLAPGPRMRSWLHCVNAEIAARTGNTRASLGHIRQAEQALSTDGTNPAWLNFFNESRLAGFAGQACLLSGKTEHAATYLRRALDNLGPEEHKQRPVLLLDLAAARAPHDADEAVAVAREAIKVLTTTPYAAATDRLPQLVTALEATPFAGELRDRIQALPPASQG